MGSLPSAVSQAHLLDGEAIPAPSLRLTLPSRLPDQTGTGPDNTLQVARVAEGIGPPGDAQGRLDLQVQITSATADDAESADLTPDRFVATLQTESLTARVGPQALSYESLIHKDRTEQGAMVALGFGSRTLVKGFGRQAGERGGYQRLLGTDRARYALSGMVAEHKLPAPEVGDVNLTAAWLSGFARPAGTDRSSAGDAWSIAADTDLLERRMKLRFEYAGSRFDWQPAHGQAEGDMIRSPRETGSAYSFNTEFQSAASSQVTWHLGARFDEVSPWFASLANPALGNDWRRLRTSAGLSSGDWKFDLSLDGRESNLDEDPSTPSAQSRKGRVSAAWTPAAFSAVSVLGSPSYKLAADYAQTESTLAADAAEPEQREQKTVSLMLQTEFNHADWLWGLRAKGSEKPGPVDAVEDRGVRTLSLHLYGDIAAGALKPTVSWQRERNRETRMIDRRWSAGLDSSEFALRNDLKAAFKLGYQHRFRSDTGSADHAFSLGTHIEWQLRRPTAGHNGLTLSLSGNYTAGDRGLMASAGNDDYRWMLSLSTAVPGGL